MPATNDATGVVFPSPPQTLNKRTHRAVISVIWLEQNAMESFRVKDVEVSAENVYLVSHTDRGGQLTCEYVRVRKKRGKGSELYPIRKSSVAITGNRSTTAINDPLARNPISFSPLGSPMVPLDIDRSGVLFSDSTFNSPRWLNLTNLSSSELFISGYQDQQLYPVLEPIINDISFIHPKLLADLMGVYFSNTVYGFAPIIRKSSVLSLRNPRRCTPALLYSFLLVSAHASDHILIKATPTTRQELICTLHDRVLTHIRGLTYSGAGGCLDDVVTYIHLGIAASTSELKGSSMKWWNAASNLARLLKFNVEDESMDVEQREERRRAWWLLFVMDRHLGQCYNRPPHILDSECDNLFIPADDSIWSGDGPLPIPEVERRPKGPPFRVTGPGMFGVILPLMVVLGGIIELHFLEQSRALAIPANMLASIRVQYLNRLQDLDESADLDLSSSTIFSLAWKEYCKCLIHIFHILLQGHWDPIDTLNNIESLLQNPEFDSSVHHSIHAAKSIEQILRFDPDLRLIPFFFGIQLLHLGFILLAMTDKLDKIGDDVKHACDVLVHAHEVCIVTLNTEYQRNFRQILRDATRAILIPDSEEYELERSSRMHLLELYRWGPGGTGLAI